MIHKLFSSFLFKLVFCEEKRWPSMCVSCNKIVMHDLIYLPHHSAPLNGVVSSQTRKTKLNIRCIARFFVKTCESRYPPIPSLHFYWLCTTLCLNFFNFSSITCLNFMFIPKHINVNRLIHPSDVCLLPVSVVLC